MPALQGSSSIQAFYDVAPDGAELFQFVSGEHSVVVALTDEEIVTKRVTLEGAGRIAHEVLVEGVPASIRLTKATRIPYKRISQVSADEKTLKIDVTYSSLGMALVTYGVASFSVKVPTVADIERFFDALQARFGEKAKRTRKELSPARSLVLPAVSVLMIAGMTAGFASGFMDDTDNVVPHQRAFAELLAAISRALGPTVIIAIGCGAAGLCVWWGYKRMKDPPIVHTLKRK